MGVGVIAYLKAPIAHDGGSFHPGVCAKYMNKRVVQLIT